MAIVLCIAVSCKKDKPAKTTDQVTPTLIPPVTDPGKGIYADSVFYVQDGNYRVSPLSSASGNYSCIPEGLKIEETTGVIDVNKSETGLKYQVTFTDNATGQTKTSFIIISGINYQDKIYNLANGDSIAAPIYNANAKLALPDANKNSIFDTDGGCKHAGIVVNGGDAKINLALSVRNQGIDTGSTEEVKLAYRINDNSNKALNGLDVKIYFYRTSSEIPQYLTDLLNERKTTIFDANPFSPTQQNNRLIMNKAAKKASRPRPPCIIVVSR